MIEYMENKDVVFICVNYNNPKDTIKFVCNILAQQQKPGLVDVCVVDNSDGETDAGLRELGCAQNNVTIMRPEENLGFYPGAAWALQEYEKHYRPEWVVVSNTDMQIPGDKLIMQLAELYEKEPPHVIAPSIVSSLTGIDQNPQIEKRPSKTRWLMYLALFRFYPVFLAFTMGSIAKNYVVGCFKNKQRRKSTVCSFELREIYAPHGSCVIFNRRYFDDGAGIEHGAFLFGETITVAESAREKNLKIVYEPRLRFVHKEHSTTGRIKSRKIARLQYQAAKYCWNAYFKKT